MDIMRLVCFPIICIYEKYTYELIFTLLYLFISAVDIMTIAFTTQYFVNCNLSNGQQTGLVIILVFVSYILIRRLLIFTGHTKTYTINDLSCVKLSKCFLYLIPPLICYVGNIKFYKNLELEFCSKITANNDNLIFILIFGIILSIFEIDNLYNVWNSILNRGGHNENRRYLNNRVSPMLTDIEIITIPVQSIHIQPNSKENIINKINNLDFINNNESEINKVECNICLDNNINTISLNCTHIFHKECIIKWINQDINTSINCPTCRCEIK